MAAMTVLFLLMFSVSEAHTGVDNRTDLHLIGLFSFTGQYRIGAAVHRAIELGIASWLQREDVLPGYNIVLHSDDSSVSGFPFDNDKMLH